MPHHVHLLSERHRPDLFAHLLLLDPEDRHLRFGTAIADPGIQSYVDAIDFTHSDVFAVFDDKVRIVGAVHLAYANDEGELGLSVLNDARDRGIGSSLFERATVHLSNRFVRRVFMHCLRENQVILHLARKNGMRIALDGSEADAWLDLPNASPRTVTAEWMASRLALFDYRQKVGAHATRQVLDALAG
jgi:ribosomal protein S18 acetylase RimI-like enzyme